MARPPNGSSGARLRDQLLSERLMIRHPAQHVSATRRVLVTAAATVALFALLPAEALAAEAEHEGILPTIARLFNFAILAGVLVYFLRRPIQDYLRTRSDQIRKDLVTAAEMRRVATAQLEQIEAQKTSRPNKSESPRPRQPNANDCSTRHAVRFRCACASRGGN